jgi:hypothetical protein
MMIVRRRQCRICMAEQHTVELAGEPVEITELIRLGLGYRQQRAQEVVERERQDMTNRAVEVAGLSERAIRGAGRQAITGGDS